MRVAAAMQGFNGVEFVGSVEIEFLSWVLNPRFPDVL